MKTTKNKNKCKNGRNVNQSNSKFSIEHPACNIFASNSAKNNASYAIIVLALLLMASALYSEKANSLEPGIQSQNPGSLVNIDTLFPQENQENSDEISLQLEIASKQYALGQQAVIYVVSAGHPEFDMLIGNDVQQVLYHYDGEKYPVMYRYPLIGMPGKYFATVTANENGATATKTVYFDVAAGDIMMYSLFEDKAAVDPAEFAAEIVNANEGAEVLVLDQETQARLSTLDSARPVELKISFYGNAPGGGQLSGEGDAPSQNPRASVQISLKNLRNPRWDNAGEMQIGELPDEVARTLESRGISVQEAVSLEGVDNFAINDYYGEVAIDVSSVDFDSVYYCDDMASCHKLSPCQSVSEEYRADELCYVTEVSAANGNESLAGKMIYIYVLYFSSIILALENLSDNLTLNSPLPGTILGNGQDILLNFSLKETLTAYYTLDDGSLILPYFEIGNGKKEYKEILQGKLADGILANGGHNISIVVDNGVNISDMLEFSFAVDDVWPPAIDESPKLAGAEFNQTVNWTLIALSFNESANASYSINGAEYTPMIFASRNMTLNLTVVSGSNELQIAVSDQQGNSMLYSYLFNFNIIGQGNSNASNTSLPGPNCSDGMQNSHNSLAETGIDCGGPCGPCTAFEILTDKSVYNQTEQVEIEVRGRSGANATITVVGGTESYSADAAGFPAYYIFTDTDNIGTYTVYGVQYYFSNIEIVSKDFEVVSNQPQNPLAVSISSNRSTINAGEPVAFNAIFSGNTTGVDFSWDFEGDRVVDSTAKKVDFVYANNGTYYVNLTIFSGPWQRSDTKTITVRKTYSVRVFVQDNRTSQAVPGTSVNLDGYSGVTDSSGHADFILPRDDYTLVVSKEGYMPTYDILSLNENSYLEVSINKIDIQAPTIALASPSPGENLNSATVNFAFVADDENAMNCSLYLNDDGSWWALWATAENVVPGQQASMEISGMEDNRFYLWKVECRDQRGNLNSSRAQNFTINSRAPALQSTAALGEQDEAAKNFLDELDEAIAAVDSYAKAEKDLAVAIDFKKALEKAKTEIQRLNRDLHDLPWRRLNQSALDLETQRLIDAINSIMQESPKSLSVLETVEFVKYPGKSDIEQLVLETLGLEDTKKNRNKISSLVKDITDLQSAITITTKAKVYDVQQFSGKRVKYSAIIKEVKSGKEGVEGELYEVVPKTIGEDAGSIDFRFEMQVVKADPVVKTAFSGSTTLVYIVPGEIDLKDVEDTKTIVLPAKLEVPDSSGHLISGLAFVDIFKKSVIKIDDTRLMIEILVIIVLLAVFVAYSMDDIKKLSVVKAVLKPKNTKIMEDMLLKMHKDIEASNYQEAKGVYKEVGVLYKQLKPDERKQFFAKLAEMHNRLDVLYIHNLINSALSKIEERKLDEAAADYTAITGIYRSIAPEFKAEVLESCKALHTKINLEQLNQEVA